MSTIMVVGPYIGEFGYELFKWQGYIRTQATGYAKVIISSRPGHAVLYKDFSHQFISYTAPVNSCAGIANAPGNDIHTTASRVFAGIPYNRIIVPFKLEPTTQQEYVSYGRKDMYTKYDIVIHARNISVTPGDMRNKDKLLKESRNWAYANWVNFTTTLTRSNSKLRICCIGHPDASLYIDNTDDKRNIELTELADLLANAKVIVGPSSGPMHFATLCRCKQVVWGTPNLIKRYRTDWNPFGTPVDFITTDETWNPSPEYVIDLTAKAIAI